MRAVTVERLDFLASVHRATKRDYVQRVIDYDKAACAEIAAQWGEEYWDGDRRYGYGGYRYDGRWLAVAQEMARHYNLKAGQRVLDVGCGKAFLLYEFTRAVPGIEIHGLDISRYALENAKLEVRDHLDLGDCTALPYLDGAFDFVYSLNTLHNLPIDRLKKAVMEIDRVSRGRAYICVESFRNEREKANLLYWQLTCRSFFSPAEWEWFLGECGYRGDVGYIFFE
jgi:SAM-dependent methyltransferase